VTEYRDDRLDPRQADKGASRHVGMCNYLFSPY